MQKYKVLRYVLIGLAILAIKCDCNDDDRPNLDLDTDRDGIANVDDQCPNTREGESVNEVGCSSAEIDDLDRDGVPNNLDECPRTPDKAAVNDKGCLENALRANPEVSFIEESNEIILSGFSNLTPDEIDLIIDSLPVDRSAIDTCSCDKNIQLWPLPKGFDLNNAIAQAKSKSGKKLSGDRNFIYGTGDVAQSFGIFHTPPVQPSIIDDQNKPIVAILDAGLDVGQLAFEGLQLLETRSINQIINCDNPSENASGFGWNFADGNADMSDNYAAHGTNVTKTFVKSLEHIAMNEFQILPLKLFGDSNSGTYWDVVCAFSYLNKLDSLGYNIALVNTSFGGQLESLTTNEEKTDKDLLVLKQLIDSLDETVVVSSAGNNQSDNDNIPFFPASYNSSKWFDFPLVNLIAVAGHNDQSPPKIFNDSLPGIGSNYGMATVDLAAPWHFTILENGRDENSAQRVGIELVGTSFSAPYVSARLLEHYIETGLKGEQLKVDFLNDRNKVQTDPNFNNAIKDNRHVH